MILGQPLAVIGHFGYERIAVVVIMMEMNFHIGNPKPNDLRDPIQQIPTVFFLRIEKTVLGALTAGISRRIFCNPGPSIPPLRNPSHCLLDRRTHSERFVMVGDRDPGAPRLDRRKPPLKPVFDIRPEPEFGMSV